MAAQGRKNVHGKTGVRFKTGYTASKNKSMLRNVVTDLILNEEVEVTSGVVKELKHLADRLVTYAKVGDLHHRRLAARVVRPGVVNKDGKDVSIEIHGRHDPVIAPRACVVVESMVALTLVDALLENMGAKIDGIIDFYK